MSSKRKYAEPGDTVVITDKGSINEGKEVIVIECPCPTGECVCCKLTGECIWSFSFEYNHSVWTNFGDYRIVSRKSEHKNANTDTEKDVDAFLKKQMDDNLSNIFG